jgi:hypothetical protein
MEELIDNFLTDRGSSCYHVKKCLTVDDTLCIKSYVKDEVFRVDSVQL